MDKSRGKDKVPPPQPPPTQPSKSLATRVVDSASSLAKDFISSTSASATTSDLASASSSEKSRNGPSISAQAGESSARAAALSRAAVRPQQESFRTQPGEKSALREYQEYLMNKEYGPNANFDAVLDAAQSNLQPTVYTPSQDLGQQWASSFSQTNKTTTTTTSETAQPLRFTTDVLDSQIKALLSARASSSTSTTSTSTIPGHAVQKDDDAIFDRASRIHVPHSPIAPDHMTSDRSSDFAAATATDGSAVIALLQSPSTTSEIHAPTLEELNEPSAEELFGADAGTWSTRPETQGFLLPPAPTFSGVDEAVDVQPEYVAETAQENARMYRRWLDEWGAVMRRYTDDVWGTSPGVAGLMVAEAERVSDPNVSDESASGREAAPIWVDVKAVRRLGMILGHLRMEEEDSMDYPTSLASLGKE